MKHLLIFASLMLAIVLVGCSSVTVTSDYDSEYDFATFKTYRWANADEINPNDELKKFPLVQKRVGNSVDEALKLKGFELVDGDDFDFVVLAHAGSKERMNVTSTGGGYGGGYGGGGHGAYGGWYDPWWGAYGGQTHVSYYEESTLVLDIVHWEKKELAWRGLGTAIVKEHKNQESMQKQIDMIVGKILASFPPNATAN